MAERADLLVLEELFHEPIKQWLLSFRFNLRLLFAIYPKIMGKVLEIVYRAIATPLIPKVSLIKKTAQTGAVRLNQDFASALNLKVHFNILSLDGIFIE